jgi:hypothetical protein
MINQAPSTKQILFRFSYLARDPWCMNLGNGAARENRTLDLTLTKGALYH